MWVALIIIVSLVAAGIIDRRLRLRREKNRPKQGN